MHILPLVAIVAPPLQVWMVPPSGIVGVAIGVVVVVVVVVTPYNIGLLRSRLAPSSILTPVLMCSEFPQVSHEDIA